MVNRRLDNYLIPGQGKRPDGKMEGRDNARGKQDPFLFYLPPIPSPVPANDCLIKSLTPECAAGNLMPRAFPDSFHNNTRRPEIHVCNPHRDQFFAAKIFKAMVIFDTAGMLPRYDLIEIISHNNLACLSDYKTNIVILDNSGKDNKRYARKKYISRPAQKKPGPAFPTG
jgi:hypothetical protein